MREREREQRMRRGWGEERAEKRRGQVRIIGKQKRKLLHLFKNIIF